MGRPPSRRTTRSELDQNFGARPRTVCAPFYVGNEGIELQLNTLSNGLLELDGKSGGIGPGAIDIEKAARRVLDPGQFEYDVAAVVVQNA